MKGGVTMKKIGMLIAIIGLTVFLTGIDVTATSGPEFYDDPGYGDID